MDHGIGELSAEALITAGGWHPAYARILLIEQDGDLAVVLVDGNGDGSELELEYWQRGADGLWRGGSTSGYGPLDDIPTAQIWNAGDFVGAIGRVEPTDEVSVEYGGHLYRAAVSEIGIWGFVHAAESVRPGEYPAVFVSTPPAG